MSEPRPRVLMVTGAYAPETSGASLQCRNLIRALRDRADFSVLTTSTDPSLPSQSAVDGTPVENIAAFKAVMTAIHEKKPRRTVFFVKRGIRTLFLEIEPKW